MANFFYIDKLIHYIKENINKLPITKINPNDQQVKHFINTCCNIVKIHNIQIFVASIETPLGINKELLGNVFVDLTKSNIFKNLKLSDDTNKLNNVYGKFKQIINKVRIIEKILYVSFSDETDHTKYLYKVLTKYNFENTRIIKQYIFPFYKIPDDNNTMVKVLLFNHDLSVVNNNITFLNMKRIIFKKNTLKSKQEILLNKLGQHYFNILSKNTTYVIDDAYNKINNINIIELNFNIFISLLSNSINKCIMCGIYDKHFTDFKYIDYYYTKSGFYCNYCERVFNKDKLISFVINNMINII